MKVSLFLVLATFLGITESYGQTKRYYNAGTVENQNKVVLHLNASSVSCRVGPTYSMHAVNVFGYPAKKEFNPIVEDKLSETGRNIILNFEENLSESLSSSLSEKVFKQFKETPEKPWYVYLSRSIPFDLELNYGMGSSSVDLSGLAVRKCKINTGSAEIRLGFDGDIPNKVAMDTLSAKVDMGVLELSKLDMARAEEVIADVGFGKLFMYLSKDCQSRSNIKASVGAGTMEVTLESMEVPVIIHVNDSPLCRVKLSQGFKKIEAETFVNQAYRADADNLLSFDVDVAMGNVIFRVDE